MRAGEQGQLGSSDEAQWPTAGLAGDGVLPFTVAALDVRGRVVRLSGVIDEIIGRHGYPAPVARLLAEAAALTVILGTALKFEGRFQLRTKSDGPVNLLVVDFDTPDGLRGYARFDGEALAAAGRAPGDLMGRGHLAFTIEQTNGARYQGIVALEGQGLQAAADQYFRQSEQIPTVIRLAAGEMVAPGGGSHWVASGLLAQFLPAAPERMRSGDLDPGDAPAGTVIPVAEEDDAWVEARALLGTLEDNELADPALVPTDLLFRLFHERGVRVHEPRALAHRCRCSRERVAGMLRQFTAEEIEQMREDDGGIAVTCEFCSRHYGFDAAAIELARAAQE